MWLPDNEPYQQVAHIVWGVASIGAAAGIYLIVDGAFSGLNGILESSLGIALCIAAVGGFTAYMRRI